MSRLIAAAAILIAGVPALAEAHGTSKSYADWVIDGSRAEMRINFAPHDFAVEHPGTDADGDQKVTGAELDAKKAEILARVLASMKVEAANEKGAASAPCAAERPRIVAAGEPIEEVQISATFVCEELIGHFQLRTRYLASLEPPHVSVATVTAGEVTAQHIFTAEAPEWSLELEPPTVGAALADHLGRGVRSSAGAALLLGLGALCFLAGLRGAAPVLGAFAAAFVLAVFVAGPRVSFAVAIPVALAGVEAWLPQGVAWRRAIIAALLGGAIGMNASIAAAAPMKIAFALGALGPALLVAAVGALLARYRTRISERAIGAAAIAGSIALLVLSLR